MGLGAVGVPAATISKTAATIAPTGIVADAALPSSVSASNPCASLPGYVINPVLQFESAIPGVNSVAKNVIAAALKPKTTAGLLAPGGAVPGTSAATAICIPAPKVASVGGAAAATFGSTTNTEILAQALAKILNGITVPPSPSFPNDPASGQKINARFFSVETLPDGLNVSNVWLAQNSDVQGKIIIHGPWSYYGVSGGVTGGFVTLQHFKSPQAAAAWVLSPNGRAPGKGNQITYQAVNWTITTPRPLTPLLAAYIANQASQIVVENKLS